MDIRRKTATIGALALVACLVQAWTISRAVVPAQDCVRYLVVAQGFERDGFVATVRTQPEQPLFPALVWFVHRTLSDVDWISADNWAICLQLAAAIPLVLSVAPIYLLFCRLHGEKAGPLATAFYCLLSGVARLGADGLSDSTHLALFSGALYCAAMASGTRQRAGGFLDSPRWLFPCGALTGLALTTRSESVVLPVALVAAFVVLTLRGNDRQTWKTTARAAAFYSVGLAAVLVPYLALCGALVPSGAVARIAGRGGVAEAAPLNDFNNELRADAVEPRWELPGVGQLIFGKKDTSTSIRFRGYLAAGWKLIHELAQTLHYWIGALALVGLWTARRQIHSPLDRLMQCVCATLVLVGIYVAAHSGYLSTRHVLLLVVLGLGWAAVGLLAIAEWLARLLPNLQFAICNLKFAISTAAFVVCGADCMTPLHASREAHRAAARWLSENAERSVAVLDSRGWTALYTGRKTYRYEAAQTAFSDPALGFVVVEQAELAAQSRRSETMRLLMNHAGEPVARFAADSDKHSVVIHRWRPERFQQLGVQSYAR